MLSNGRLTAPPIAPPELKAQATPPLLIDVHEAARLLGISERTLWQLTKDGQIACKKIGRRVLYTRQALEEFARS